MNVYVNYEAVDSLIQDFRSASDVLRDGLKRMHTIIGGFQDGGFWGRNADNYIGLMRRRMDLIQKLIDTNDRAVEVLQAAKTEMQQANEQLKQAISSF